MFLCKVHSIDLIDRSVFSIVLLDSLLLIGDQFISTSSNCLLSSCVTIKLQIAEQNYSVNWQCFFNNVNFLM